MVFEYLDLRIKEKEEVIFSMHFGVNLLFIFRLNPEVFSKF